MLKSQVDTIVVNGKPMRLTNKKTKVKTTTNNKSWVARQIGVSRITIHRWSKEGKDQIYNHFILKF